jgi:hypothetical protein
MLITDSKSYVMCKGFVFVCPEYFHTKMKRKRASEEREREREGER